ncbi:MAG: phosphoribosyltransferase [Methanothrix sp.]|uniref:phosphoribosyltransferase n=1 Tax=Methanothrix sp. TaxID=90426 RepID=UPI0025EB0232|nr:phosphoribosyltransferase [Methanothrix sp.]MCQ8903912.1 phosphoribosyltransferase [Methanothrix sp.]
MTEDRFDCQLVSWEEAYRLELELAARIKSSGYRPDLVIAIGRGGFVPARVVCDRLLHTQLTSIRIERWGVAAHKLERATIRFPLSVGISNMRVLVVDDVTDTGDTLSAALEYLWSMEPDDIKTGVLHHKLSSRVDPDYCSEIVKRWRWIVYPWAFHEEMLGFVERVLSGNPLGMEEIRLRLKRVYGIDISEPDLSDVLEDALLTGKAELTGEGYVRAEPF